MNKLTYQPCDAKYANQPCAALVLNPGGMSHCEAYLAEHSDCDAEMVRAWFAARTQETP